MSDIRRDRGRRKIIGMKSDGSPNYAWRDDDDFTDNSLDSGDIYYADDDFSSGSSYRDNLSMSPKKLSAAITDYVSYGNPDLHSMILLCRW